MKWRRAPKRAWCCAERGGARLRRRHKPAGPAGRAGGRPHAPCARCAGGGLKPAGLCAAARAGGRRGGCRVRPEGIRRCRRARRGAVRPAERPWRRYGGAGGLSLHDRPAGAGSLPGQDTQYPPQPYPIVLRRGLLRPSRARGGACQRREGDGRHRAPCEREL